MGSARSGPASRRCTRRSGREAVVVQLNRLMPRTLGESFIHVDDIDLAVEVDVPPYDARNPMIGDVERHIGEHVAELVPTGDAPARNRRDPAATGAGLTTSTTLASTRRCSPTRSSTSSKRASSPGAAKERNRGKIVTTFLDGVAAPLRFVHDNPMVEMRAVDFTNDTHVIRWFRRMVAINSAIEVDLTGQVVADSIGHPALLRCRRTDGLHTWRRARAGGAVDHRPAVDGRGRVRRRASSPPARGAGVDNTRPTFEQS